MPGMYISYMEINTCAQTQAIQNLNAWSGSYR